MGRHFISVISIATYTYIAVWLGLAAIGYLDIVASSVVCAGIGAFWLQIVRWEFVSFLRRKSQEAD
jgi:energy-converting hydrogenase Eha subunit C